MALECLEIDRLKCKTLLQQNILHAKKLLSENFQNINLSGLIIKLNECIHNLNIKSNDLEQIHEKLSLASTKDNEEEILTQIENDFDCIIMAIDIKIELEVFEKETKDKIKDLKTSAKILPLAQKLDTLLSKTESQMTILRRNQIKIMDKFREYSYKDLQQEDGDVERIDSNNLYNAGSEDADGSIMNTNYIANGTTLEADNNCQPMGHMSSCERPMGHQEQTVAQGQEVL